MRVFLGLSLNENHDCFQSIQEKILSGKVQGNVSKDYHITLKFLGDVSCLQLDKIRDEIGKIPFNSFSLSFGNLSCFMKRALPAVVYVKVNYCSDLIILQQKIEKALFPLFPKDVHSYYPHCTLMRMKKVDKPSGFVQFIEKIPVKTESEVISHFHLYQSILTPEGPVYKILETVKAG